MGLRGYFGIFQQNLLMQIKQVRRNVLLVLIPVVVFFFVYLFFSVNEVTGDYVSPITMAVIDEDNTTYSDMLVEGFRNNESFSQFVDVAEGDEAFLTEAFEDKTIDVLIRVPEGFIEGLATEEALPLDVQINYKDPVKAILFKNVIQSYEKYIRSIETSVLLIDYELWEQGVPNEMRWSWRDRSLVNLVFVSLGRNEFFDMHPVINVPSVAAIKYYFIALMVMFLMYISVFAAVNMIREKQDMCFRRIRTSRVSLINYISAKTLAITVYIYMIVCLWLLAYRLFYGPLWQSNGGLLMLFLAVCIYFNVSLAMFFTIFFDDEEPVVLLSSIVIFFNAVIGGSIIPIHNMPYVIQRMANGAPNYWMIKGFLYLDFGYRLQEIFYVALGLVAVGSLLTILTGKAYSREVA